MSIPKLVCLEITIIIIISHPTIIMENPLASMLRIQPITQHYKWKTAWKALLQSIQPLQKIQSVWLSKRTTNLKVGVSLDHGVSLCFVLFPVLQHFGDIPSKDKHPASIILTQVSQWSHKANTHLVTTYKSTVVLFVYHYNQEFHNIDKGESVQLSIYPVQTSLRYCNRFCTVLFQ